MKLSLAWTKLHFSILQHRKHTNKRIRDSSMWQKLREHFDECPKNFVLLPRAWSTLVIISNHVQCILCIRCVSTAVQKKRNYILSLS